MDIKLNTIKLSARTSIFFLLQYNKFSFFHCSTVVILLMWARFNAAPLKKNGSRLSVFSSSTVL